MDVYITLLELTWTTVQMIENKDKQKLAEKQKSKMNNSVSSNWNSTAGDASKSRSGRRSPYNYISFFRTFKLKVSIPELEVKYRLTDLSECLQIADSLWPTMVSGIKRSIEIYVRATTSISSGLKRKVRIVALELETFGSSGTSFLPLGEFDNFVINYAITLSFS